MSLLAVIPAAGLGTRMATVTRGASKELLNVGGRPVLQWVVDEAILAGANRVKVVGSPVKPQIKEMVLNSGDARLEYGVQEAPRGIADAVRVGAEAGQPALVLMGDTIYASGSPLADMTRALSDGAWAAVAVAEVPLEEVVHYGVVGFSSDGTVNQIVEKPTLSEAPSRFAVASRFALSGEASSALFEMMGRRTIEGLTLTDLLEEGIRAGKRVDAVFLSEAARSFDCGQPDGYRRAVEALGA